MATIPPPKENQEENKGSNDTKETEQVEEKLVATEDEKSIATTPSPDNTSSKVREEKPTKKKTRCAHPECKKKVTIMGFDCRCGLRFCSQHVAAEEHDCTFDYKEAGKRVLQENNQLIAPTKVTKI